MSRSAKRTSAVIVAVAVPVIAGSVLLWPDTTPKGTLEQKAASEASAEYALPQGTFALDIEEETTGGETYRSATIGNTTFIVDDVAMVERMFTDGSDEPIAARPIGNPLYEGDRYELTRQGETVCLALDGVANFEDGPCPN